MNFWLHRISHHAELSYPLLEKGILSIGFSDLSTKELVDKVSAGDRAYFDREFVNAWGKVPRTRVNLWHFIHDIKKNDIVIVPSWGTFSVYTIDDNRILTTTEIDLKSLKTWNDEDLILDKHDYICLKNKPRDQIDLGFFRKVTLVQKDIPRDGYADTALTARLKYRMTTVNISDLKNSIEKARKSFKEKKPINLYGSLIDKLSGTVLESITGLLSPDKFEKLVKWYFEKIGADSVEIPAKNKRNKEGDADIIATFEKMKTIIYIQVKHHIGTTSSWAIEQVSSYKSQKDSLDDGYFKTAWVITSAENFDTESTRLAKQNGVLLVSGKAFAVLLVEAGIGEMESAI